MRDLNPSQKAYEYVFQYFSDQIMSGKLKLNDKVPTERDIAEQLGSAATPSGRLIIFWR